MSINNILYIWHTHTKHTQGLLSIWRGLPPQILAFWSSTLVEASFGVINSAEAERAHHATCMFYGSSTQTLHTQVSTHQIRHACRIQTSHTTFISSYTVGPPEPATYPSFNRATSTSPPQDPSEDLPLSPPHIRKQQSIWEWADRK